jgi:hypothetical protein
VGLKKQSPDSKVGYEGKWLGKFTSLYLEDSSHEKEEDEIEQES